jgi:hypothetical protein
MMPFAHKMKVAVIMRSSFGPARKIVMSTRLRRMLAKVVFESSMVITAGETLDKKWL